MTGLETDLVRAFDGAAVAPVALLLAVAVGAVHGLSPGHGKTVTAAYLVGVHARWRHAAALAAIVAGMHTGSVLVLALLWWATMATAALPLEAVTRWAQLAVAVLVLALGLTLARRRWREHRTAHRHEHGTTRRHAHAPPPGPDPWSRAGLVGIASAGGLLPSPSAFLILVSGLLTGRAGLALGMVAAFGLGLGATVLGAGLLTLAGRDWLNRRPGRSVRALAHRAPLLGATMVLAGGCLLSAVAVADLVAG